MERINMPIGDALLAQSILFELAQKKTADIRTAYRVARILECLTDALKTFNTTRNKLFQEYGEHPDGDPNVLKIKPENLQTFNQHIGRLQAETVTVECAKISHADMGGIELSAADVLALKSFIDWSGIDDGVTT